MTGQHMKRGAESEAPNGANESEGEMTAGGAPTPLGTDEQEQGQPSGDSVAAAPADSNPATTAAASSNAVTSTKEQTKARRENGLRR